MKKDKEELVDRIKGIFELIPEIDIKLLFKMKKICDEVRNIHKGGNVPTHPSKIKKVYSKQKQFDLFMKKNIIKTDDPNDFITLNMLWNEIKKDKIYSYKLSKKDCKEYFKKITKFEERAWINKKNYRSIFRNIKINF